ncbi:sialidase family protein [Sunxiuqinia sp. A32]|uniref:sialidase family protein n=1 Tax=Sunxiuqinia sp. A32 TaxID=3461496 RepID=UPI0040458349
MRNLFYLIHVVTVIVLIGSCKKPEDKNSSIDKSVKSVKVFYEEGRYGGWPANVGIWSWSDEILVGFTVGDHEDKESGHTIKSGSASIEFARSKDGGITWYQEDGFDKSTSFITLDEKIDFSNADLAFSFLMQNERTGPTAFFYSYNRGEKWNGPYKLSVDFPDRNPAGIVSRTDYLIESKHEMTAFLTVGFKEGNKDWREVACVRTYDGGKTWRFLSWIGPNYINSIMPSSVRLDSSRLLTMIRRTKPPRMVSFLSEDNGNSWTQLADPVTVDSNGNPPALLKLEGGRLCLVYGIRQEKTMPDGIGMYVSYSSDEGLSWNEPELLRGHDGACWDIGYPRSVLLPDGKVVAVYYYNNANAGDKYRYISASILNIK